MHAIVQSISNVLDNNRISDIRNFSVIAHVDHGKTTVSDTLVRAAHLSGHKERFMDGRKDEIARGISIKSTGASLYVDGLVMNLIDSPGHVDFSSEVTAALRLSDGALVVVDASEGVCVQTETVLRQALAERVRPLLMVNKIDRMMVEQRISPDEAAVQIQSVVARVNAIIDMYAPVVEGVDFHVDPSAGSVVFGAGRDGWCFSVPQFAEIYSRRQQSAAAAAAAASAATTTSTSTSTSTTTASDRAQMFWGQNYYDAKTKSWVTSGIGSDGSRLQMGFAQYVLEPLWQLVALADQLQAQKLEERTRVFNPALPALSATETTALGPMSAKELLRFFLARAFPCAAMLVRSIRQVLPSPLVAQRYRTEVLYTGDQEDETARAMKRCDPNGPLCVFVSKLVFLEESGFMAFARVFSGTLHAGQRVRVLGPAYTPGSKSDLFVKNIARPMVLLGPRTSAPRTDIAAGMMVGITGGLESCIVKSGTLATEESTAPIRPLVFSVAPVVRVAVKPASKLDVAKLQEGLRKLAHSDPIVMVSQDADTGDVIIGATGDLHLEILLNDLRELARCEVIVSEPSVSFRETVTAAAPSPCLAKSGNKLNRVWLSARPLPATLSSAIAALPHHSTADAKAALVAAELSVDRKKVWEVSDRSVLIDETAGATVWDSRDHFKTGFRAVCESGGVLCGGDVVGVHFSVADVSLHADGAHRGGAQLTPAVRRALQAAQLSAKPRLLEPIFELSVSTESSVVGGVYSVLSKRRGVILSEEPREGTPLTIVKAYVPVLESFGLVDHLRSATSGKAFPQANFSHYDEVPGDPLDPATLAGRLVQAARVKKGLPAAVPPLVSLVDKL